MSAFPTLKLQYFDHEGLAEAIRLALFIGNVPFEDVRLTEEEFAALQPTLPFGQVPVLDIDNGALVLAQSQALLRYTGRLAQLYPINNPLAALRVDEILNVLDELRLRMEASRGEDDLSKKKAMREELAESVIPETLGRLEPRLVQLQCSPGVTPSTLLVHDIVVFLLLKHFRMGVVDYIPSNIADTFPELCASFDRVDKHAKVKEWYALQHDLAPRKLTLTYVDQAGRAEPIRLALFIGGIAFEDERIVQDEVAIRKGLQLLPFDQLPVLEVNGEWLAQSFPILRYAGTLAGNGLYPAHDSLAAARVDEILSALDAFDSEHTQPLIREKDLLAQAEMARQLSMEAIPKLLTFLDARVGASSGAFACGDTLTVADLAIFSLVAFLSRPPNGDLPNTTVDPFIHLKRVYEQVDAHPKVTEWYETHARY